MMARRHSPAFPLLSDFGTEGAEDEKPDYEAQCKSAFEDGHQQGLAEGRAEAQADAELRLAEAETVFAERINLERQAFRQECADALAARLDGAVKQIERTVSERVADLLRPWLVERLREQAIGDLVRAISRALAEGAKIHIEAPAEVLTHLHGRLPNETFQIGYSENATPDIRAHIEDTVIEANIDAWISELEAASA
jgi:flagellar biosynthesis/type III secretory pathway protein FliH